MRFNVKEKEWWDEGRLGGKRKEEAEKLRRWEGHARDEAQEGRNPALAGPGQDFGQGCPSGASPHRAVARGEFCVWGRGGRPVGQPGAACASQTFSHKPGSSPLQLSNRLDSRSALRLGPACSLLLGAHRPGLVRVLFRPQQLLSP